MQIARFNGQRLRAKYVRSGDIGECIWTGQQVKAKVGELRQYWSYIGDKPEIPEGYENETIWHYNWKSLVKDDFCEVVYGEQNEHRADIVGNNNNIIEIQLSPIDIRLVRERINFYKKYSNDRVIWIVDATKYFKKTFDIEKTGDFYKAKWKNKRQWVYLIAQTTDCHLFLDINHKKNYLLKTWVNKGEIFCIFYEKTKFYKEFLSQVGQCISDQEVMDKLTNEAK